MVKLKGQKYICSIYVQPVGGKITKQRYHPECSKDCPHQDELLAFKSSPNVTSSVLNPLADICLPRYVSNELTDYVNIPFKENVGYFVRSTVFTN